VRNPSSIGGLIHRKEQLESVMENFVFHHVGVAVRELSSAAEILKTLFDYKLISGPFDDPIQKVSVSFLARGQGDPIIELVAPLTQDSPVIRTLEKGGGTYHVCYEVPDIKAAINHLTAQGCFLLSGPVPAVAFEMREIAWLMTAAKLLVELVQA
jgi:methylmalonyl-CoA/ethylmalonyl-CoA epimerase